MNANRTTTRRSLQGGVIAAALALAALLAAAPQAQAASARYQLDPEHISMGFLVEHLGYAKVLGMFRAARGSYSFDEDTGTLSDVRIEVDTRSVFTSHAKRDQHLMSADFLNAAEFPRIDDRFAGQKTRYGWFLEMDMKRPVELRGGSAGGLLMNCLFHKDFETGREQHWWCGPVSSSPTSR